MLEPSYSAFQYIKEYLAYITYTFYISVADIVATDWNHSMTEYLDFKR